MNFIYECTTFNVFLLQSPWEYISDLIVKMLCILNEASCCILLEIKSLLYYFSGESRHTCFTPGETKSTNIGCPADSNGFGQRVSITSVFYHLSNQGCSTQESALMQNCVSAHETITEESRTRCNWRGYCSIDFTYPETPDCDPNFSGTIVLFVHYECYPGEFYRHNGTNRLIKHWRVNVIISIEFSTLHQ